MKIKYLILGFLLCLGSALYGQPNHTERLTIPFYDPVSQSNVVVNVCDLDGTLCPAKYTNLISNTNLFTPDEQKLLKEVMTKYKNVATNLGPPGSKLVSLGKTNCFIPIANITNSYWRAVFEYTNSGAEEEILFVQGGITSKYQNKTGNGYVVGVGNVGGGSMLRFGQIKRGGVTDGLSVEILNNNLQSYMHYTNGLVIGKYFMWNPRNNKLIIEAAFKEPYDLEKHKIQSRR